MKTKEIAYKLEVMRPEEPMFLPYMLVVRLKSGEWYYNYDGPRFTRNPIKIARIIAKFQKERGEK